MSDDTYKTGLGKFGASIGLIAGVCIAFFVGWGILAAIGLGIGGMIVVGSLFEVVATGAGKGAAEKYAELGDGDEEDRTIEVRIDGELLMTLPAVAGLSLEDFYEAMTADVDSLLDGRVLERTTFGPGPLISIETRAA